MARRLERATDPTSFRTAISQWQLAARTEVKRASALPSSMFDACDPMLEACLVDSVEAMLECLQHPSADVAAHAPGELRTEQVTLAELARLPSLLAGDGHPTALDTGLQPEYLGVLVDTCLSPDTGAARAAGTLLRRDFDVDGTLDIDAAAAALFARVRELRGDAAETDEETLAELCRRIVSHVAASASAIGAPTSDGEGRDR